MGASQRRRTALRVLSHIQLKLYIIIDEDEWLVPRKQFA
jgi:hypothetical protein